jgi:hypothetical protein
VRAIEPDLVRYAKQYDVRKYPPTELVRLRTVFAIPGSVIECDIVAALVWKYGHTGKTNFPMRQRALASRIAEIWSANRMFPNLDPMETFQKWRKFLGSTSFITVCFLLHLINPATLPILDQHNYRSVNRHLRRLRSDFVVKAKPSQYEDLLLVRDFGNVVLEGWQRYSNIETPTADILDRYLMMHGKAQKSRSREKKTA